MVNIIIKYVVVLWAPLLTLTIANCYIFFFERDIVKQINNSGGLYVRYIDDIFITINWPTQHLFKQIDRWNKFDLNIKLKAEVSHSKNFLDLYIENINGELFTKVYHKPSYEPYYLPFNSVHAMHMKKNIQFAMLIRTIKYCSIFEVYLCEREKLRMALLLNKYPGEFIEKQFSRVFQKHNLIQPILTNNHKTLRKKIIYIDNKEKISIDYGKTMFIHFTYCLNMKTFSAKFHALWNKCFMESPIDEIKTILGTRNVKNLQQQLIRAGGAQGNNMYGSNPATWGPSNNMPGSDPATWGPSNNMPGSDPATWGPSNNMPGSDPATWGPSNNMPGSDPATWSPY
ncbi:unnamed protein product [Rotaria sp. Silwood1]|nr:unnamed protein product [Rotaria sp. Silwood1]CAF4807555.1 unnamed protein product [Rotaria sp. Silwood1]